MRPTRDEWAMSLAKATALRATCLRRQVGCVLLNARGHVLATGYNGVAAGLPHCNEQHVGVCGNVGLGPMAYKLTELRAYDPDSIREDGPVWVVDYHPNACPGHDAPSGQGLDACQAIHSEQNALLQCRDPWQIDTAYVTASPCVTCLKLLLNTSCRRIVYSQEYPHPEARAMWERAERLWEQLP